MWILFITGVSGSGKTTVLKTLEDMGFYTVDNIPTEMILQFISLAKRADIKKVALSIFVKTEEMARKFLEIVNELKSQDKDDKVDLIFIDAQNDVIMRRYKETRRKHPFSDLFSSIESAIKHERKILDVVSDIASIRIDTTDMNIHKLRSKIVELFGEEEPSFILQIYSFGFRYGIPRESDIVFDVRFVRNPNFDPALKDLDGTHPEVQKYVFEDEDARKYLDMIKDMIAFLVERFKKEGKYVATVSIGCTGGKHRSVAFAEALKNFVEEKLNIKLVVIHRDKHKDSVV